MGVYFSGLYGCFDVLQHFFQLWLQSIVFTPSFVYLGTI